MKTSVRGNFSTARAVISWVPHVSVLGPLLFVIHIDDLPGSIINITKLFAYGLKMVVNAAENDKVNSDFSALEDWESTWLLKFNVEKCKVLHLILGLVTR